MPEVSDYGIWHNVCTRCQDALKEMGIEPTKPPEDQLSEVRCASPAALVAADLSSDLLLLTA